MADAQGFHLYLPLLLPYVLCFSHAIVYMKKIIVIYDLLLFFRVGGGLSLLHIFRKLVLLIDDLGLRMTIMRYR